MKIRHPSVRFLTHTGLMCAVTCVLAPLSIPIGPVPFSLTSLVLYFSSILLGCAKGCISYLLYLLIGMVGVPVFSGYTSGPQKLFGPTGGYLFGFFFLVLIAGAFADCFPGNRCLYVCGMVLGTVLCYLLGTAWLAYVLSLSPMAALMQGVIPFLLWDAVKIALAVSFAPGIKKLLVRSRVLK